MENKQNKALHSSVAIEIKAWLHLLLALALVIVLQFGQIITMGLGMRWFPSNEMVATGVGEILAGLAAIAVFILLGGIRWVKISRQGFRDTMRITWPFLAFTAILFIISAVQALQHGGFADNIGANMIGVLVPGIGIGLLEEGLHRGAVKQASRPARTFPCAGHHLYHPVLSGFRMGSWLDG
ncbi:MAG: hypothetical protein K6C08_07010 [Oscillospiraceae bacterium]|nr:hypothetical protein [Oscillospiraceae bacterium]